LNVSSSSFLAVMGASGSGKSTLLNLMAGLTTPDEGQVFIDNTDIARLSEHELTLFRRHRIGLVFQAYNLIPTLTALDNVLLPVMLSGQVTATARDKAAQLLARLGLAERGHHRPDSLSGGEQQRVAIARALINDPALILADEPTGNLDSVSSRAVCQLLKSLAADDGRTIVMVTHEPTVAVYADEVLVLKDGRILDRFTTASVGSDHNRLSQRYQQALDSTPSP
jgi:putative ABC transport system ATP-binding protein